MRLLAEFGFLILFVILLVIWLVLWAAMRLAGGFIHLVLIIAILALIIHFFRRRTV
jgi:hypothetical protein